MSETKERTVVKKVGVGSFANGKSAYAVLYSDGTLRIDNVRASYPHLFRPFKGKGKDGKEDKTAKYSIKLILPKSTHGPAKDLCVQRLNELLKENKLDKMASDKKFIRNGDDLAEDAYANAFVISASETKRPDLRDRDKRKLTDADEELLYGGCYVNALIRPWFQNHQEYGKRVNAGISAVQFAADGEPFGTGRITSKDVDDSFDDIDDDSGSSGGGSSADDDDDL